MEEKKKLGEILLEAGVIDKFQLKSALAEQNKWGGRLGNHLVQMGILTEELLVKALSKQLKIPNLDLSQLAIPKETLALVPQELAEKFHLVPVAMKTIANKKTLIVAMSDPTNLDAVDELQFRTGHIIKPAVAGDTAIEMAIRRHYYGEEPPRDASIAFDPGAQTAVASNLPSAGVTTPPEQTFGDEPTVPDVYAQAPIEEASLADLGMEVLPDDAMAPAGEPAPYDGQPQAEGELQAYEGEPQAELQAYEGEPQAEATQAEGEPYAEAAPYAEGEPQAEAAPPAEGEPYAEAAPYAEGEYGYEGQPQAGDGGYTDASTEATADGSMDPAFAPAPYEAGAEATVADVDPNGYATTGEEATEAGYDASASYDPNVAPESPESPDPNAAYDANAGYDPNAAYDAPAPADPNAGYEDHAALGTSGGWEEGASGDPVADPNAGYDPNVSADPNAGYDAGAGYDATANGAETATAWQPEAEPTLLDPMAGGSADGTPLEAPEQISGDDPRWSNHDETQPEFAVSSELSVSEPSVGEHSQEHGQEFSTAGAAPEATPGPAEAAVAAVESGVWSAGDGVQTGLGGDENYEATMPGEPTYAGEEAYEPPHDMPALAADGGEPAPELAEDPLSMIPFETAEGRAVRALIGLLLEKGLLGADEVAAKLRATQT